MTGSNPRHPAPEEVRAALLSSTGVHDTDPFYAQGEVQVGSAGFLRVMVHGNDNNIGDPTNFRVWLHGADGWQLAALTLHIPAYDDLAFFQTTSFPFAVGDTSPGVQVNLLNLVPPAGQSYAESFDLQLGFKGFNSGDYVDFNDDRGDTAFGYIDDDADRVGGTTFTAELTKGKSTQIVSGVVSNRQGSDWWTPFDGYGLINADLAVANTK